MSDGDNDNFWTKLVTFVAKPAVGIAPTDKQPVHRALHEACLQRRIKGTGSEVATEMLATVLLRVENSKDPVETCKALHVSLHAMKKEGQVTGQKIAEWYKRQLSKVPYLAHPEGDDIEHYVSAMKRCKQAEKVVGVVADKIPMIEPLAVAHGQKMAARQQSEDAKSWLGRVSAAIGVNKPQR